jgi:hypothetical protein
LSYCGLKRPQKNTPTLSWYPVLPKKKKDFIAYEK